MGILQVITLGLKLFCILIITNSWLKITCIENFVLLIVEKKYYSKLEIKVYRLLLKIFKI